MSNVIDKHLKLYPSARQSTLIILQRKSDMMKKLRDEIQAEKRRKDRPWLWRMLGWRK